MAGPQNQHNYVLSFFALAILLLYHTDVGEFSLKGKKKKKMACWSIVFYFSMICLLNYVLSNLKGHMTSSSPPGISQGTRIYKTLT